MENILIINDRKQFREWLKDHYLNEKECWIKDCKRGRPKDDGFIYYLDAVEEALCFGWIDSVYKKVDGNLYQKFGPRRKNSHWTLLNVARVKRLEKLGLMSEYGLSILPKEDFIFDEEIIKDIKDKGIYEIFIKFPKLYQEIKLSNLASIKSNSKEKYMISLNNLVKKTKENQMISGWDDYGRLK